MSRGSSPPWFDINARREAGSRGSLAHLWILMQALKAVEATHSFALFAGLLIWSLQA